MKNLTATEVLIRQKEYWEEVRQRSVAINRVTTKYWGKLLLRVVDAGPGMITLPSSMVVKINIAW